MATDHSHAFDVAANGDGIQHAVELFGLFAQERRLSLDETWELQIALDEWLTNVVEHGYEGRPSGTIGLRYAWVGGELEVQVIDDGPAFDPLALPPPDVDQPILERDPGGLGVYFIRRLMDRVEYHRRDGHNTLVFAKRLRAVPRRVARAKKAATSPARRPRAPRKAR